MQAKFQQLAGIIDLLHGFGFVALALTISIACIILLLQGAYITEASVVALVWGANVPFSRAHLQAKHRGQCLHGW